MDFRFRILDLRTDWPATQLAYNIFNPQSKFQNLNDFITKRTFRIGDWGVINYLPKERLRGLFLNHKMHPSVLYAGFFGLGGINGAFFAVADRNEPDPFDAFAD